MTTIPHHGSPAKAALVVLLALGAFGGSGSTVAAGLTATSIAGDHAPAAPLPNAVFLPPAGAMAAGPFSGTLRISQAAMQTIPALASPIVGGRDARLFPAVTLAFFCLLYTSDAADE